MDIVSIGCFSDLAIKKMNTDEYELVIGGWPFASKFGPEFMGSWRIGDWNVEFKEKAWVEAGGIFRSVSHRTDNRHGKIEKKAWRICFEKDGLSLVYRNENISTSSAQFFQHKAQYERKLI